MGAAEASTADDATFRCSRFSRCGRARRASAPESRRRSPVSCPIVDRRTVRSGQGYLEQTNRIAIMSIGYAGILAVVVSSAAAAQSRTWEIGVAAGGGPSVVTASIGGGLAFARAMPEPAARSLNFLGSAGAGLRFGSRDRRSLIIGYRFTHLSNANTAAENPGFNAHVFYLGITFH